MLLCYFRHWRGTGRFRMDSFSFGNLPDATGHRSVDVTPTETAAKVVFCCRSVTAVLRSVFRAATAVADRRYRLLQDF